MVSYELMWILGMFLLVVSIVSWQLVMTKGAADIQKALITAMIGLISSVALFYCWQMYIFPMFIELYL